MSNSTKLDNAIWYSLKSKHSGLALTHGSAARYPAAVSVFAALRDGSPSAFEDLRKLVADNETVALSTASPVMVPDGWTAQQRMVDQMILENASSAAHDYTVLKPRDVPDMQALVALTEPGPFAENTIAMGQYLGIRSDDGSLIAMAGQRMRLDGFIEVSAVCTHPNFQGKGLARSLVTAVVTEIVKAGSIPFLHVKEENGARLVYEKLGFRLRAQMQLTVLTKVS
jgi:predicted GNAT family acetyltransferase